MRDIIGRMIEKKEARVSVLVALMLLLVVLLVSSTSLVSAADEEDYVNRQEADDCLAESQNLMGQLMADGFNSVRINDTMQQAQSLYDDAVEKKRKDYVLVTDKCTQIQVIYNLAYNSRDEFEVLQKFYTESVTEIMNTSEVDKLMINIEEEIWNERYERIEELIDEAYEEIINLESSYTTFEILKRNSRNFLIRFFTYNWEIKLIIFTILAILYFVYRKRIWSKYIKSKMHRLELRRKTIKGMVRNTQKQYFEHGTLAEGIYNIKTKKFAELIRDIDRQLPILQEELTKLERNKRAKNISIAYHDEDKEKGKERNKQEDKEKRKLEKKEEKADKEKEKSADKKVSATRKTKSWKKRWKQKHSKHLQKK